MRKRGKKKGKEKGERKRGKKKIKKKGGETKETAAITHRKKRVKVENPQE